MIYSSSESECDTPDKFYFIRKLLKQEFRDEFEKNRSPSRSTKILSQKLISIEMLQKNFSTKCSSNSFMVDSKQ
jgi:hypothetical protein